MTIASGDKRHALCELLRRYRPIDAADEMQRAVILEFIEKNADCFERSNRAGHITGSAWLVDPTGKKVLLTHHKKLGMWLQLGGHADGDPDALATALREAKEESSLAQIKPLSPEIFDVDVHPIPARPNEPAHFHYDIRFAFQAADERGIRCNDESNELAWVDVERIHEKTTEPSMLRMATKWRRA